MQPGPGMYAAGQKWLQQARIDVAKARNVVFTAGKRWLHKTRIDATQARNVCTAVQKWLQKAGIDATRARNVCRWPEMVAEGRDRCYPGQECMQQARNGCRRPG
jgi:hypothetical protein